MDNPDCSEWVPDVRHRVAELVKNEPNRFFDHRPKTPPDCSLSVADVRQRVEELVKHKHNRFSDLMSKTPRDRISDSSYWNYPDSSDIKSSTSRISHVSHRDSFDTPDIQLVSRPWKNEIKKSKIPVVIPVDVTEVSRRDRLGKGKERDTEKRKQIWSGLCIKRSKIPISVTRRTKMAEEKSSNQQTRPKLSADNKRQSLTKDILVKPNETKENIGSKVGKIKDSIQSNKMDLNRKILTPVETTEVTELKDSYSLEKTTTTTKKSDQTSCKPNGKLSQHPVARDGSAVESSKIRSKRLKKRKERTPYFIVDGSSSDEETPIRIRGKVKRGERTLLSSDTEVNAKMHQVACWLIALPDDIGDVDSLTENSDGDKSVDGLNDDQRGSQRLSFAKSVQKRWRRFKTLFKCWYPPSHGANASNIISAGQSGMNNCSSLSRHPSDLRHIRGQKSMIGFFENVELVRNKDTSTEVHLLNSYSGSDQGNFQRLSFVERVQKGWRRFKTLFKCCTCGRKEE